jgi:hypothetical protein
LQKFLDFFFKLFKLPPAARICLPLHSFNQGLANAAREFGAGKSILGFDEDLSPVKFFLKLRECFGVLLSISSGRLAA